MPNRKIGRARYGRQSAARSRLSVLPTTRSTAQRPPGTAACPLCADIVAKVENRTTSLLLRRFATPPRRSVIDFG